MNTVLRSIICLLALIVLIHSMDSYASTNLPAGPETQAQSVTFCSYCTTEVQYEEAAMAFWKQTGRKGDSVTEVINPSNAQTYFVEVIYQPADYAQMSVGSVSTGTTGDQAVAEAVIGLYGHGIFIGVQAGDKCANNATGAFNSFGMWSEDQTCPAIYIAFTSDPSTTPSVSMWTMITDSLEQGSITQAAKDYFGLPVATIVFLNGDVAQYTIDDPGSNATCTYKKGSARTKNGQFINDSGNGGYGVSNGSGYVQEFSNGSTGIQVSVNPAMWQVCTNTPIYGNLCYLGPGYELP